MLRKIVALAVFLAASLPHAALAQEPESWQAKVAHALPLLGHRNWILIVDSAYPLQSSPGIETIDTHAPQTIVLRVVLSEIENSEHLRPDIFTDAELPYVADQDAPGISQLRANLADLLHAYPVQSQAARQADRQGRPGQPKIPGPRAQDQLDPALLVGLHQPEGEVLERRGGIAAANEDELRNPAVSRLAAPLPQPHQTPHRSDQLLRVIPHAILENRIHLLHIRNVLRRIAIHHHQIRVFARRNRSEVRGPRPASARHSPSRCGSPPPA